ncbi:MAG: M24 family metallopeptidase [Treponema sp.]|jgi:Xaa-Pro dipeptidase|nr:M24 family metallopeptidase [Treponema sp.]
MKNSFGVFEGRRAKLYDWMAREGAALAMFEDFEGRRDPAVRWMTGHPMDALVFLSIDRSALLVPWDVNLARRCGCADSIIPYGDFGRQPVKALRAAAEHFKIPPGSKLEIPPATPYPRFLQFVEALADYDILCRNEGIAEAAEAFRAVKDEEEIRIYRRAAEITNGLIDLLEETVRGGKLKTETDAALFIEAEARNRGCEGTGFETLAAGPGRSFGIHAFPAFTGGPFAGPGLSILDFGLKYHGYTTDVTLTFAAEPLSPRQRSMVSLVERAYKLALSLVKEGAAAAEIAARVEAFFGKFRKAMPHALGHGIGLEAHEAPVLHNREDNVWRLAPGMVITLEPGLYDSYRGGCRLENDLLVTGDGAELLTGARIIRL